MSICIDASLFYYLQNGVMYIRILGEKVEKEDGFYGRV